jgi:apolipoprotein N-acyltransferase
MTGFVVLAASALAFYGAIGLGEIWPLVFLAPIPVLWFAYAQPSRTYSFGVAFGAYALGGLNFLEAYWDVLPPAALAVAIIGPAIIFATGVLFSSTVYRRLGPFAAALFFACYWTGTDYLVALGPDGAAASPAYSLAFAPFLVQIASLFGLWALTFLIGFSSAGFAAGAASRKIVPSATAMALLAAATIFGWVRLDRTQPTNAVDIVLLADDSHGAASFSQDEIKSRAVIGAYLAATAQGGATDYVLWPEKLATLAPAFRDEALAPIAAEAQSIRSTIIAGFDERGAARLNRAYVFQPGGERLVYDKRRLVPGLERGFAVGRDPMSISPGVGVAICKDMDFPAMIRNDARALELWLMLVPAWDFGRDARAHQRMAVLRGVENGFAVARSTREGILSLTDAYGRTVAETRSDVAGMRQVRARLPLGPGRTLYKTIGDSLPIGAIVAAALLAGLSLTKRRQR